MHGMAEANIGQVEEGQMRAVSVGDERLVVIRTSKGVFALDNACPHEGYGLATGDLAIDESGEPIITCQWHNWKFNATDGTCLRGEESVRSHAVSVDSNNDVSITVEKTPLNEVQAALWNSFRSGFEKNYVGQMSRDAFRLMRSGITQEEILWEAVRLNAKAEETGPGHAMAMAADCLALAQRLEGDDSFVALAQGFAGLAEQVFGYPPRPVPAGDASIDLCVAIEAEDIEGAMASVVGQLESGVDLDSLRAQFIEAVSVHHIGFGHGAIYTQKAFELLDMVGWENAIDLLPHLAAAIAWMTREDVLPYMRKEMRVISAVDLDQFAGQSLETTTTPVRDAVAVSALASEIVDSAGSITERLIAGSADLGIEGVLDALAIAASQRMLRYDSAIEADSAANFGWLDMTHVLTYTSAIRWAWRHHPGPDVARLVLFAGWFLVDSGRVERSQAADGRVVVERSAAAPPADEMVSTALHDAAGSFIYTAHLVKTIEAARIESAETGSDLPLVAAHDLLTGPRRERFVAAGAIEAKRFVSTGVPPKR